MFDPFIRNAADFDVAQQAINAEDLAAVTRVLQDPVAPLFADRVLMVGQNGLKIIGKKGTAGLLYDLRSAAWFVMSRRSLCEKGLPEFTQIKNPFQRMKALVDSINDVSTLVWAPVALLNKYGTSRLARIAAMCGGKSSQKLLEKLFKVTLTSVAIGRWELDAMQKGLSLAIATSNKGIFSADFVRSSLEVGRITAQALGYSQTSYFLGMTSASIGAWQIWNAK